MPIGEGEVASKLQAAIEGYRSRPLVELSGEQLGAEWVALRHQVDLLEVEFAKLASRFAETDEWDDGGFYSPIHWIRVNCHLGGGAASDRITLSEQLDQLPLSAAALDEGGIGFGHLALLARTSEAVSEGPRSLDEGRLLAKGLELTVTDFRKACQRERHAADPNGFAKDERETAEERKLTISSFAGGGLFLKGVLDPVGGAAARAAPGRCAGRACRSRPRQRRDPRPGQPAGPPPGHHLARDPARPGRRTGGRPRALAADLRQVRRAARPRHQRHSGPDSNRIVG